jgi:hypothetical protein
MSDHMLQLTKIGGLLLFFLVFVSVFIGAIRRPKTEVDALSKMALEEPDIADDNQVEIR